MTTSLLWVETQFYPGVPYNGLTANQAAASAARSTRAYN